MMAATPERLILLALFVPFVGALLIPLFHKLPNLRETVTLVTAGVLCARRVRPAPAGARRRAAGSAAHRVAPALALAFKVEPLGMLFALVASSLWIVNSIYSIGYMRANDEPRQTSFYVCFAIALGSTIGIAFAKNLFTLFLFYEALTISTYPLVTHKGNDEAIRAGRIYLLLLLGTSLVLFLPAIVATWVLAGTLDFTPGGILAGKAGTPVIAVLLALYVFGIGKAAVMPLHFWLPAAMVAPTPVSALAARGRGRQGRRVHRAQGRRLRVRGRRARKFRRQRLAHLRGGGEPDRCIARCAVAGQSEGAARLFDRQPACLCRARCSTGDVDRHHRQRHADRDACGGKITLFFCAGAIYTAHHLTEVSEMSGIGRKMPITMLAFLVASLSIIGLPPMGGTWSKWLLAMGALDAGRAVAWAC